MKLKIDTERKEVTLLEEISFKKLKETMVALFPEDFNDYNITSETQIIYNSYPVYRYTDWWYQPINPNFTVSTYNSTVNIKEGCVGTLGIQESFMGSSTNTLEYKKEDKAPKGEFIVQVY